MRPATTAGADVTTATGEGASVSAALRSFSRGLITQCKQDIYVRITKDGVILRQRGDMSPNPIYTYAFLRNKPASAEFFIDGVAQSEVLVAEFFTQDHASIGKSTQAVRRYKDRLRVEFFVSTEDDTLGEFEKPLRDSSRPPPKDFRLPEDNLERQGQREEPKNPRPTDFA